MKYPEEALLNLTLFLGELHDRGLLVNKEQHLTSTLLPKVSRFDPDVFYSFSEGEC